ncbi:hypothetical protein ACR80S_12115 [Halomonas sp. MA07-2]|uniref:hypothetical protein n=1 Tax=unclassified Halomonas TaxID=2609666 RepID=UPI003EEC9D69
MLLEAIGGEFDPAVMDEEEVAFLLEPFQASFRRTDPEAKPRRGLPPGLASRLDMESSLKAQGINSIEELMQALQVELGRGRQR